MLPAMFSVLKQKLKVPVHVVSNDVTFSYKFKILAEHPAGYPAKSVPVSCVFLEICLSILLL
jgi:aspartyl/asparaginyl beta-hydroxylase (cupin superfamily)